MVKPSIPCARRGGNERTVDVREVVNGLMYVLGTGCQWRAAPKDLPPRSTVDFCFCRWQHDGTLNRLHHARHVLVDTQGLLMEAVVHAADIQDRDGGVLLMASLFGLYPFLLKPYADAGYGGRSCGRA